MTCHASRLIGLSALSFMLLIHAAWTPTIQSAQLEPLGGTITSDGVAMEGVVVSARLDRSTVTTTVFTDARGVYRFPALADGNHHVWAQAEGFATARATATVSKGSSSQRDFTMQPITDMSMQASGSEWMAALPAATKEQRRMRELIRPNCTQCHSTSVILSAAV